MIIRALGDIALHEPSAASISLLSGLPVADMTIANLEIPLTDRGTPAEKVSVHRAPVSLVEEYARFGVDVWTVGTNHLLDFGEVGMVDTLSALAAAGQRSVGAGGNLIQARTPVTVSQPGERPVTVINACSTLAAGSAATALRPGVSPLRIEQSFEFDGTLMEEQPGTPPAVRTRVVEEDAAEILDLVERESVLATTIVALHWGVAWPSLPPNQGPLAEYQQPFAHKLIEAGAGAVIGHHSHSLQPIEFYRGHPICYSLGNFAFHFPDPAKTGRHRSPVLKSVLKQGPWSEGAVYDLITDGSDWRVQLHPILLDEKGDPHLAQGDDRISILERVRSQSSFFGTVVKDELFQQADR